MLNRQRDTAAEHVAQLTCELAMLRDNHGVEIERACVVYVQLERTRGSPSKKDIFSMHGGNGKFRKRTKREQAAARAALKVKLAIRKANPLRARHNACHLPASWVRSQYRTEGWSFLKRKWDSAKVRLATQKQRTAREKKTKHPKRTSKKKKSK
jgi:hypothetical protein